MSEHPCALPQKYWIRIARADTSESEKKKLRKTFPSSGSRCLKVKGDTKLVKATRRSVAFPFYLIRGQTCGLWQKQTELSGPMQLEDTQQIRNETEWLPDSQLTEGFQS